MEAFLTGGTKKEEPSVKQKKISPRVSNLPWVEKYRPKKVGDIVHQDEVVALLKKCVQGVDLPNLLFYGPPGTGKTSAALALCIELFGADGFRNKVLELNASNERGIQVVRNKIKDFSRLAVSSVRADGQTPCVSLKLIILDEADSMTRSAQAALRRTMETESGTTRFVLICNYISRIIDPLTSRCAKFRFKPLLDTVQKQRLELICMKESVEISPSALDQLISVCEGDLRESITFLQSASICFRNDRQIQVEDIRQIVGMVPQNEINSFIGACKTNNYDTLLRNVKLTYIIFPMLIREGYPAYHLVIQLFDIIVKSNELQDNHKAAICERLALCEYRLVEGADEFLALMDLGCIIMTQYKSVSP